MKKLRLTPHPSISYAGSSAPGAPPSADQDTGTGGVTSEARTRPREDVGCDSRKDHTGGDVAMRGNSADENSAEHRSSSGSDSRRRITTQRGPRKVRQAQTSVTEQLVPKRISAEKRRCRSTELRFVNTQESLDGYREKSMRIANVENDTLNWVSISSAGALGMTHCDVSERSARDEIRHVVGSSEPDVIIGSDKDQNRGCRKKDKDHVEFLCEVYEAQVARGRFFVHELTSEVNLRMQCLAKTWPC